MRETRAVRNLLVTLLTVVLLQGIAHAGVSESAGCLSGAQWRAGAEAACPANLLYPGRSVFLREDVVPSEGTSGLAEASVPGGGAAGFWLPDSMEAGWLARDKKLHFLACYSIVLTGEAATDRPVTGVVWAAGLSIAKELWDLWFKTPAADRGVSRGDLVADAAGIVAAVIAVEAFGD